MQEQPLDRQMFGPAPKWHLSYNRLIVNFKELSEITARKSSIDGIPSYDFTHSNTNSNLMHLIIPGQVLYHSHILSVRTHDT